MSVEQTGAEVETLIWALWCRRFKNVRWDGSQEFKASGGKTGNNEAAMGKQGFSLKETEKEEEIQQSLSFKLQKER